MTEAPDVLPYVRRILQAGARLEATGTALPTPPLPVLWLLGRTGAGKTSLLRGLVGQGEVGAGFAPCTRSAQVRDHPAGAPVLRFLDTRGLDEAGYDPTEDLAVAEAGAHAVLIPVRLDDPAQGRVAAVLADLMRRRPALPVLVVHTGADLMPDPATLARARAATQARLEAAAGRPLPAVTVGLPPVGAATGLDDLRAALARLLPEAALLIAREAAADAEARAFAEARAEVLWHAGAAGAADAAPLLGAIGVPAVQGVLLRRLARRYDLDWTPARIRAFAAALGAGAVLRMGAGYGLRQLAKLVPVAGQTLGAAAAAGLGFAATYALGRAAHVWLHAAARGEAVDAGTLRARYAEAFEAARHAGG